MAFTLLDFGILVLYLVSVAAFGAWLGKKQKDTTDYFLGGRKLPWLAVCFSVVATETSTLTFISIPGLAYLTNLNFLQITLGYLLGRIAISVILLPGYYRGELSTAYQLLGNRFGGNMRRFASVIFQLTRLLADGVRLFATAIPLSIITGWNYSTSIIVIAVFTIIYTYMGGIRAVVWMDVIQMIIYIGGAILAVVVLIDKLPDGLQSIIAAAAPEDKLQIIYLGLDKSWSEFFQINYTLISGLLGGAFLSMASHGTDHLIVQRLLTCNTLRNSQKALIGSGIIVIAQFALFLFLGLGLYAYYGGASMRSDEILPRFIVEGLPAGISGIIIAGIFAAAMSTLSGSLNSLASSTMFDLYKSKWGQSNTANKDLLISRLITFAWGLIFVFGAMIFKDETNPVVELGLAIASFTYGGLLGTFFLGTWNKRATEEDGLAAIWSAIFFMTWIIGLKDVALVAVISLNVVAGLWIISKSKSFVNKAFLAIWAVGLMAVIIAIPSPKFAWPWYVLIGCTVAYLVGSVLSLLKSEII